MQVSVETTQGLERKISISVPADQVDSEVKNRLRHIAKTQKMNGFRPGKVPPSVVQKRYGKAVRDEVAGDLMQRHFVEAIVAEKINPAGRPEFVAKSNEEGKELAFEVIFEVFPEVELADLAKIKVERPVAEVTDEDLDEMFVTLQNQHKTWKENKRKTKKGDKLTIDFLGRVDGEEFEGGKAEGFELELGAGRMIPGFEKEITGMKVGEEKTINVTFPEDYHAENLKGKDAEFDIKVSKTEGPVLPTIDEEFAKLFGIEDGNVDALRAEVRKNMERELSQALKAKVKEQVIEALLEANELDLPKASVSQEVDVLRQQAMQRFAGQGQIDPNNMPDLPAEMFEEQAKRRVKTGLLLGELIKNNELKVDEAKVKELIESAASAYEDPQEVVDYYMNNAELKQQMENVALEEQAVDFITEKAKVTDKEVTFQEIMNPQAK
jgi:trigger factor